MGPPRRELSRVLSLALVAALVVVAGAGAADDDVAGPIVKLVDAERIKSSDAAKPASPTVAQNETKPETIAQILDAALQKEFEEETAEDAKGGQTFNATVQAGAGDEVKLETVVRITGKSTHDLPAGNATEATSADGAAAGGAGGNSTAVDSSDAAAEAATDVDRIIDSQDNEFVLSKPKESVASLTLDMQLIQDLSVLLVSAALFGSAFEAVRQPVINGYLIGGAVVGPGGLNWVKELVQVESLAQLGVQLLLFGLGLELSPSKLRAVWDVAVMGGSLQVVLLALLGGLVAAAAGAPPGQGIFVGALLSMSSTAVVVKCLEVMRTSSSAYGQITVGTLILQDCMVGLMFALVPVFKGGPVVKPSGLAADTDAAEAKGRVVLMVLAVLLKLSLAMAAALAVSKTLLPPLFRLMQRKASRELVQLALVAFCCGTSSISHDLGLSSELGAFVAGVMVAVALGPGSPKAQQAHGARASNASGLGSTTAPGSELDSSPSPVMGSLAPMATIGHGPLEPGMSPVVPVGKAQGGTGDGDGERKEGERDPEALDWAVGRGERERESRSEAAAPPDREWRLERERERQREKQALGAHAAYYSIESARNVLVALFMSTIGLIMSPRFLMDHLGVLTMGVAVVVVVKGALVAAVVRMFSVGLRTSLAVGLSMAHVGEFAFVLLSQAVQADIVPLQVYMLLLGVTALSLLTTPFIVLLAMHWVAPKDAAAGLGITIPARRSLF